MRQARLPNWKIAQLVNPKNTRYQQNCKKSFPMLSPVQKHPVRTSRSVRPGPSAPARPPWPVRPGPFVRPGPTWDMGPGPWIWILPEIMAMADGHGHRPYNHEHGLPLARRRKACSSAPRRFAGISSAYHAASRVKSGARERMLHIPTLRMGHGGPARPSWAMGHGT